MGEERRYEVAVIEGDGIGPELVTATLEVLDALAADEDFTLSYRHLPGGAAEYLRNGSPLSEESMAAVRAADAVLKGPVGLPEVRFPDGTEAGLLGGVLRGGLDTYANVRPVLLLPGVESPLKVGAGAIDYTIVRENTEGLYASRGLGVGNDWAMTDTLLATRPGCERVSRYACELARRRSGAPEDGVRRVTCVDKANVLRSLYFFRQIFLEVAADYPDLDVECLYVDAAAQALVLQPGHFSVIVTENLLGDILSDLGGATIGGISLCGSGNIGDGAAYFEPIHGSAPSIAGKGLANPVGQLLSAALMFEHLGEAPASGRLRGAVARALADEAVVVARDGSVAGGASAVAAAVCARVG
ncbi:MAG TPA: isocitrate/isopropylmalate family dehydrogenase [Acidimicrobiales bacterium]|nr:isocitrate/isopropylmalate family dehydrogenase [Acidimicrobiales bacterium]